MSRRRDLGDVDVPLGQRQLAAVVGEAANALELPGDVTVEHEDLATARRGLRIGGRLAVEAHEAARLLDDAVRLAGNDVAVVRQTDVERLAAAAKGEQHTLRFVGRCGTDGDGALERADGTTEALDQIAGRRRRPGHDGRDHLRVGRDGVGDAQPVLGLQVGVVVDVAVQRADDVRTGARTELFLVERVGVRFGDDPDARPARVAQHREPGRRLTEREVQQRIAGDRRAHHPRVVAELADLGGCLVHEAEHGSGDADRSGREQRIAVSRADERRDRRVVEVETVVPHVEVDAGGVTASHLESVERRQRLLDREEASQRRRAALARRELVRRREPSGCGRCARPRAHRAAR